MRILRRFLLIPVLVVALAAGGCGGEEGRVAASGAELAPADTAIFVSVNTDFESEQWRAAEALLAKFPAGEKLVQGFLEELEAEDLDFETDVKPAVGPELGLVFLGFPEDEREPELVALTQPRDPAKLDALLAKADEELVKEVVEGWTVIAENEAILDRFAAAREQGSLADAEAFEEAMDGLAEDALARIYVNGESLKAALEAQPDGQPGALEGLFPGGGTLVSVGAALTAEEDGVRLDGAARIEGGEAPEPYEAELLSQVPAGAAVYVSFNDVEESLGQLIDGAGETAEELGRQLSQLEFAFGISLEEDILPLFGGEGAFAVHEGDLFPAVTLALEVDDPKEALETVNTLVAGIAGFLGGQQVQETVIEGVAAKEVSLGQFSLYYAALDDRLVVTTAPEGISGMREGGPKLADDPRFRKASDRAGMPAATNGFVYVDIKKAVLLLTDLFQAFGDEKPPGASALELDENLEPLETLLLYSTAEDELFRIAGFLAID